MHPATRRLHEGLIRSLKGLLAAWTKWLEETEPKNTPAA